MLNLSMSNTDYDKYFVYIMKCADNTLYTGITNDPEKRLAVHNSGKGAKYTRGRLPVEMIYKESAKSKGEALSRESEIKKLSRIDKLKLCSGKGGSHG